MPALADQRRELDYLIPPALDRDVTVGTIVRVPLHGRRVAGWVVARDVEPPEGIELQALLKVTGRGPGRDLVDLSTWAAWRWAGRRTAFLRAASPPGAVRSLPVAGPPPSTPHADGEAAQVAREALAAREAVVRVPPAADPLPLLSGLIAGAGGPALIVGPEVAEARRTAAALTRVGIPAVTVPSGWARAAAGGVTVVGARAAAWAPAPDARAVVVLDAHDDALIEERAPTWNAWRVAAERARRARVPCVLVSACPRVEQLQWGALVLPSRAAERAGWAAIEVLDRRDADPREGLVSERVVRALRDATIDQPVVCVLNRIGRIRMLACRACGTVTVCEHCGGPMQRPTGDAELTCARCTRARPPVCQACGSGALRALRVGVSKLREDLEALGRAPVGEVTATVAEVPATPILVGTEAVLHRSVRAAVVVFIEFDQELLAPRHRAAEDALALLARASRTVGGRQGRVIVQTRLPSHEVLAAAVRADPGPLAAGEAALRTTLALPPATALAQLSGSPDVLDLLTARLGAYDGVEVLGPADGRWLVRAPDHTVLCDALAAVGRPPGVTGNDLRVDVDPTGV